MNWLDGASRDWGLTVAGAELERAANPHGRPLPGLVNGRVTLRPPPDRRPDGLPARPGAASSWPWPVPSPRCWRRCPRARPLAAAGRAARRHRQPGRRQRHVWNGSAWIALAARRAPRRRPCNGNGIGARWKWNCAIPGCRPAAAESRLDRRHAIAQSLRAGRRAVGAGLALEHAGAAHAGTRGRRCRWAAARRAIGRTTLARRRHRAGAGQSGGQLRVAPARRWQSGGALALSTESGLLDVSGQGSLSRAARSSRARDLCRQGGRGRTRGAGRPAVRAGTTVGGCGDVRDGRLSSAAG